MNKSLEYGRADVEWWIPFVCAIALVLPLIPCEEIESRATLDFLRAIALGLMGYAGFWIAGRAHRKKYINPGVDGVGGVLTGVIGLMGTVVYGFPWLVLIATYRDKKSGPTPLSETAYGKFLFEWPLLLSVMTSALLFIWWIVAIYHVARRNTIEAQEADARERRHAHW